LKRPPLRTLLRSRDRSEWPQLAAELRQDPATANEYYGRQFPRRVEHFTPSEARSTYDFHFVLAWTAASVSAFSAELNEFSAMRARYENSLLKANFLAASSELARIEQRFGTSYWLIEAKSSTHLEAGNDQVALNEFRLMGSATVIKDAAHNVARSRITSTASVILGFSLVKAYALDPLLIRTLADSAVQRLTANMVPPNSVQYFKYRAGDWHEHLPSLINLQEVLSYEARLPVIDRYITLVKCFEFALALTDPLGAEQILQSLAMLDMIEDKQLQRLRASTSANVSGVSTSLVQYAHGEFENATTTLWARTDPSGAFGPEHLMAAQVTGATPNYAEPHLAPAPFDYLLEAFRNVTARGKLLEEARRQIRLFIRRHSTLSFCALLAARLHDDAMLVRDSLEPTIWGRIYFLYLDSSDSQRARYAPQWATQRLKGSSASPQFRLETMMRAGAAPDAEVVLGAYGETQYGSWTLGRWLYATGFAVQSDAVLRKVNVGSDLTLRYRAAILRAKIALRLNNQSEFIAIVVALLDENPHCVRDIDWTGYFDAHGRSYKPNADGEGGVCLAYMYATYDSLVGFESPLRVVNVLEDVFDYYAVSSPEQIPPDCFSSVSLRIRFLEKVCVPKYFDGNSFYDSVSQGLEARIRVLELLAQINPDASARYMSEIRQIREDELIAKCLRDFRSSLLFVSEEAARKVYEPIALERLQAIRQRPKLGDDPSKGTFHEIRPDELTGSVDAMVLLQPYREFRDIFVLDKHIGLNTVINSRLRHGVVPNMLLRPITDHGIAREVVAVKLRVAGVDGAAASLTCDVVARLVNEYASMVRDFAGNTLKVRLEHGQPGMFDFIADSTSTITAKHLTRLARQIDDKSTTTDLLLVLSSQMRDRLALGAAAAKRYLLGEFHSRVATMFDRTISALKSTKHSASDEIRGSVVEAKQSVLQCISTAADWFEPSDERFVAPMEVATVVAAAYKASRETLSPKRLSAILSIKAKRRLRHACIRPMFMLTTIVLENAVTHCGEDKVEVVLTVEESGKVLRLTSTSSCAAMTAEELGERRAALRDHLARIETGVVEHAERDSKSGIAKILKLIVSDMGASVQRDIDYVSQSSYCMKFEIDADKVLV
jgi:hypothetical protein